MKYKIDQKHTKDISYLVLWKQKFKVNLLVNDHKKIREYQPSNFTVF